MSGFGLPADGVKVRNREPAGQKGTNNTPGACGMREHYLQESDPVAGEVGGGGPTRASPQIQIPPGVERRRTVSHSFLGGGDWASKRMNAVNWPPSPSPTLVHRA